MRLRVQVPSRSYFILGAVGVEPTSPILEIGILPLNYAPGPVVYWCARTTHNRRGAGSIPAGSNKLLL